MAQVVKDSFLDLERHRQLLEANIEKLRKSLQHWQSWEAEYEGLKEEILALGRSPTYEQLVAVGNDLDGKLVTQAEIEDILGTKVCRTADQVIGILARRIDYVSQNVKTLEKQIEAAENKLAAATVISNPDVRDEEGLPLTEIIEELDDDGNVISRRTETQGSAREQLLEVLGKAGVNVVPGSKQEKIPAYAKPGSKPLSYTEASEKDDVPMSSETPKKAVQFAEGTKAGPETKKSQTQKRIESILKPAKQQNLAPAVPPFIPDDESPEDAALRREMLDYSMSEIGPIVAELDLEEDSDYSDEDSNYDEDMSDVDDEDEFGRSKRAIMNDELKQRMTELEEKLGFSRLGPGAMINVGPNPNFPVSDTGVDGTSNDNIKGLAALQISGMEKKSVRFAEDLDVSPAPEISTSKIPQNKDSLSVKSPLGDIVERTTPREEPAVRMAPAKRQSRFKNARAATLSTLSSASDPGVAEPDVPPIPEGKTLADIIVERETPKNPPLEPDELDPVILQQEVTTEFYRMRNRMVQKQGGFLKDPDEENGIIPRSEEEGGPRRMSRFKAARLARS
jgi:unconventional prefoldin RPB5 interactor 1